MIVAAPPPSLILPDHYQSSRPAIIRPGLDIASYFPENMNRGWRRAVYAELVKTGRIDKAMIPPGLFAAAPAAVGLTYIGHGVTTSSTTIALPGGIAAGDTILVIYGVASGSLTITGFTETANANNPHILYKMSASGSEGSSLTIASGTVRGALAIVIRGVDTTQVVEEVVRTSTADPPSITPSWGTAKPSAFIAMAYLAGASGQTVTTWPTSYTDGQGLNNTYEYSAGNAGNIAAATRFATLASDNPSAFAFSPGTPGNARTCVLKSL